MAIYGIGTDLVEVARIEQSLTKHGDRFRDRIFTPSEIAYCESLREASMFRSYAARFAAKELPMLRSDAHCPMLQPPRSRAAP